MTKTLTEQWRDGEWIVCNAGKCDYYYTDVKCYNGSHKEVIKEESVFLSDYDPDYEILGKVPSYDEYNDLIQQNVNQESAIETYIERIHELEEQIPNGTWFTQKSHNELLNKIEQLQKKLEIATKALKEYAEEKNWRTATTVINTDYFEYESSMYNLKDNGFEEAQKALKEMEGVK